MTLNLDLYHPHPHFELMNEKDLICYLSSLEYKLLSSDKIPIELTTQWIKGFTYSAGVYVVFQENKVVYVGETGCIRKRMNELRNTRHHTLRRIYGKLLFSKYQNYQNATLHKEVF